MSELYACLKKVMHILIVLIALLKLAKPIIYQWTSQLIRSTKIFVCCL